MKTILLNAQGAVCNKKNLELPNIVVYVTVIENIAYY